MSNSKKIYKMQESMGNHCGKSFLPNCEWEVLLLLTVILFVFNNNNNKVYNKYHSKNNIFLKNNRVKPNDKSNDIYNNEFCENYTKGYGKYKNKSNTSQKDSRIKSNIKCNEIYSDEFDENYTIEYDKYQKSNTSQKDSRIKSDIECSEIYNDEFSENYTKEYGKYQNINNASTKESRKKTNNEFNETYKAQPREDHIRGYGKYHDERRKKKYTTIESDIVPNGVGEIIAEDFHNKNDFTSVVQPSINFVNKVMKSNDSQEYGTVNDKVYDKEVSSISLPVESDSNKEEISITNCFVENNILPSNDSNLLNINAVEADSNPLESLGSMLKKDYRGVMVCAIMPNGTTICGEVAFNFNNIVALKCNNTIVFINENNIISFY